MAASLEVAMMEAAQLQIRLLLRYKTALFPEHSLGQITSAELLVESRAANAAGKMEQVLSVITHFMERLMLTEPAQL